MVAEEEEDKSNDKITEKSLKGLSILLAEDNIVNQKITAKMLQKVGCVVDTAVNGKEVVDRVLTGSYKLILMDSQMPEMDGFRGNTVN